jgi:hypothetical protein
MRAICAAHLRSRPNPRARARARARVSVCERERGCACVRVRARVCACAAALTESACSPFHRSTSASSAALRAAAAASSASSSAARRFSASICSCGPDAAARFDAASACDCASACARRRSSSSLDADARRCTAISAAIPFDMLWSCTAQRGRLHRAGAAEHARGGGGCSRSRSVRWKCRAGSGDRGKPRVRTHALREREGLTRLSAGRYSEYPGPSHANSKSPQPLQPCAR